MDYTHLTAEERYQIDDLANVGRVSDEAWDYARKHLQADQWSPEQIAGRIKLEGLATISHETTYQRVLQDKKEGGTLYQSLRCKKKKKKRYGSARSTRGTILGRVDIDQRPKVVDARTRVGDWEGDTIIGNYTGGAVIASMVERKSRYTILAKAKAKDKTTAAVIESINNRMLPIAALILIITLDNGREFTMHEMLSLALGADVFFAKPYHS